MHTLHMLNQLPLCHKVLPAADTLEFAPIQLPMMLIHVEGEDRLLVKNFAAHKTENPLCTLFTCLISCLFARKLFWQPLHLSLPFFSAL